MRYLLAAFAAAAIAIPTALAGPADFQAQYSRELTDANVAALESVVEALHLDDSLIDAWKDLPPRVWMYKLPRIEVPHHVQKRPGLYSRTDWAEIIDSTWGPGLPLEDKLSIHNNIWTAIDEDFACFQDLDFSWDSVYVYHHLELQNDTVSKGRFAAMISHAGLGLRESHTKFFDMNVYGSTPHPGVPLMFIGDGGGQLLRGGLDPTT